MRTVTVTLMSPPHHVNVPALCLVEVADEVADEALNERTENDQTGLVYGVC